MAIPYVSALELLRHAAGHAIKTLPEEAVPLCDTAGRISAKDITSPISSPIFDTSAMDGYAIRSCATLHASPQTPALFRVIGSVAAGKGLEVFGDAGLQGGNEAQAGVNGFRKDENAERTSSDSVEPCLEIMTGARFPTSGPYADLDACVRLEHVVNIAADTSFNSRAASKGSAERRRSPNHFSNTTRTISVTRPIPPNSNRRPAGTDIQQGVVLLRAGQRIRPVHTMPLAAVGIRTVAVRRRPRVGVWSTGAEISQGRDEEESADVNGPFLMAALQDAGCEAVFLGALNDDVEEIGSAVARHAAGAGSDDDSHGSDDDSAGFDFLVTSGGVSVGKFDLVRAALERLGADIVFHGVKMRPGHPVLFAVIPTEPRGATSGCGPAREGMPFFGLPGNPGAAAACFRFLVVPFLRTLLGQEVTEGERPVPAHLLKTDPVSDSGRTGSGGQGCAALQDYDCFRPGTLRATNSGDNVVVDAGKGKGPAMLSPYTTANCWLHIPPSLKNDEEDQMVLCYSLSPRDAWL